MKLEKYKILLVDDDVDFLDDMQFMLEPEFNISLSQSSSDAYEKVKNNNYDLIVLDLNMPAHFGQDEDMEGLSLLKKIRNAKRGLIKLPVIMVSANKQILPDSFCKIYKLNGMFLKPICTQLFIDKINKEII